MSQLQSCQNNSSQREILRFLDRSSEILRGFNFDTSMQCLQVQREIYNSYFHKELTTNFSLSGINIFNSAIECVKRYDFT